MKRLMLDEIVGAIRGRALERVSPMGVSEVSTDSRAVRRGDLFFAIPGEQFDGHGFVADALRAGAVGAVVSRREGLGDVPEAGLLILVPDTVKALGQLGRFHRQQLAAQVIAVTGSNGKTTTKMMIDHVLAGRMRGRASAKSFNNAIGVPLTLLSAEGADEYLVVEVGTNAPGEVSALGAMAEPEIGVITSVSASHLAGLGNVEAVAVEKLSLLKHIRAGGCAMVNTDLELVRRLLSRESGPRLLSFGARDEADLRLTDLVMEEAGISFRVNGRLEVRLEVLGGHNAPNALAALAVARRMGMTHDQIAERLSTFRLPPMRLERVECGPVTVINDAYNANPASMRSALGVLADYPAKGRRICALGDMLELGEDARSYHESLGEQVGWSGVDYLVYVGGFGRTVTRSAKEVRGSLETKCHKSSEAAGRTVERIVRPGDVVLVKGSRRLQMERVVEVLVESAKSKSSAAA